MKRIFFFLLVVLSAQLLTAQIVYNPNVAIKPIGTMSVYKVDMTDSTTAITFRIINQSKLPPFTLKSKNIILREVSDTMNLSLVGWENAKFFPEQYEFSYENEIYEFTLMFEALVQPVKYIDVIEQTAAKDFYVQGIIIDEDLNTEITRGFRAFQLGDSFGALEHFTNVAEMDLYFEYGLAYFNIIYILTQQNRWPEAKEWYEKFKNRFFYDKQVLLNGFSSLGILQRLEEGK